MTHVQNFMDQILEHDYIENPELMDEVMTRLEAKEREIGQELQYDEGKYTHIHPSIADPKAVTGKDPPGEAATGPVEVKGGKTGGNWRSPESPTP